MSSRILAEMTASISEQKRNPMGTDAAGVGLPVARLQHNQPAVSCVPARADETLMDRLEDQELNAIADSRSGEAVVKISLDDL